MNIIDEMLVVVNKESRRLNSSLFQKIILKNTILQLSNHIVENPRSVEERLKYILFHAYPYSQMYYLVYEILYKSKFL